MKLQELDDKYEQSHNWDNDHGVLNDEETKTKKSIIVQNSVLMQMASDVSH